MEAALKNPPPALQKLVELLIPPGAREGVAGDLWERYRGPWQYLGEAITALPFVVASQARRNANLPVTGLQTFILFCCLRQAGPGLDTGLVVTGFFCFLLLGAAYQGITPPSPSRAGLETVLVAFGVVLTSCFTRGADQAPILGWTVRQQVFLLGPILLPLLCIFRTRLVLGQEQDDRFRQNEISRGDMRRQYRSDAQASRWRNRRESVAFATAALTGAAACFHFQLSLPFWSIAGIYGAAAAYLLLAGAAPALPVTATFSTLRALYQRELAHQDQLRRFMWWLWLTPLLFGVHLRFIEPGLASGDIRRTLWGLSLTVLLCFVVGAVNRERGGHIQEVIGLLSRLKERKAA